MCLLLLILCLVSSSAFAQGECNLTQSGITWSWNCPSASQSWPKINLIGLVDDAYITDAGNVCFPTSDCETQLYAKYGNSWPTWAAAMSTRLTTLGFTGASYYSFRYIANFPIGGLPYVISENTGQYAIQDTAGGGAGPFHVKNAAWIQTTAGMKCGTNYYNGLVTADPYDPGFPTAYTDLFAVNIPNSGMPNAIAVYLDDADNLGAFNKVSNPTNSHPDVALMIASMDPVVSASSPAAGGGYSYTNQTFYAKQGLAAWLQAKYTTIAALNAAWGTSYTTFGTSDVGGLTGISLGTYVSYGTGTGLLDEAGTHLVAGGQSCSGLTGNGPQQNESWGATAQIQIDIDGWMAQGFAVQWATQVWTAYKAACGSYCSPAAIPIYNGPVSPSTSSVYAAIASALAGDEFFFWMAPDGQTTVANFAAVVQGVLNSDGNTPVVVANYFVSQPQSFIETPEACSSFSGSAIDCQTTQAARGSNWVSAETAILHLRSPNGCYCMVGFDHWMMYDQYNYANFGISDVNDNLYDSDSSYGNALSAIQTFNLSNLSDPVYGISRGILLP